MVGGQINRHSSSSVASFPIQLLVNYWEISPSQMGNRLDQLLASGITHVVTFVPWQALEADISHSLPRFIQALTERKMTVSLIVTPELGVHFASSGLPKDVMGRSDASAQHFQKGPVQVSLAPNSFHLPSLLSAEFTKRYHSFLSRIDNMLYGLEKTHGGALNNVTLVLTGSFWKYYRSPVASCKDGYSSPAGDYSPNASIAYRQRLEDFYSQAEFNDPTPMAANRWKSQSMEDVNRRWFYQQSEAVFRNRTLQFARRKTSEVGLKEVELFTPEADPSLAYSFFLNSVSGCNADFHKLSSLIDDASSMLSMAGYGAASSFIHWTSLGSFRSLTDSEKQFLILKSLLLLGAQGGGVLIDEEEWLSLSRSFRTHAEAFARSIERGDLELKAPAVYLAPHLWSGPTALWREFSKKAKTRARKAASLDLALADRNARLLMVDPGTVFTREVIRKLIQWVSCDNQRVLALPRSVLFTENARAQLELIMSGSKQMDVNLGVSYRVLSGGNAGQGKLVIYDVPESALTQEMQGQEWTSFVTQILALAEIETDCQASDSRIELITLERADRSSGLFVLNGSRQPVSVDLFFPVNVSIADLATVIERSAHMSGKPQRGDSAVEPAKRFTLDVPPCGVLPLAVERVGMAQTRAEQSAADRLSDLNFDNAMVAAANELPGLDEGFTPWN
jgi:hypothetical protein